jgi:CheY-like chemotaxis protein/LmbE family N-acetylglucosaminyl deacetylase
MSQNESNRSGNMTRILLVEDSLVDGHLLRNLLERDGNCRVTLVQDGVHGIEEVEKQSWDLVICDLNLPGSAGLEVIRASRRNQSDTPVLVTTGYGDSEAALSARQEGAEDILTKPVDPEILLVRVAQLLSARQVASSRQESGRAEELRAEPETSRQEEGGHSAVAERITPPHHATQARAAGAAARSSRTVLAIGAHPADVELGCGGILLRHRDRGDRIVVLTLLRDPSPPADEPPALSDRFAKHLGAHLVLGDPDWKGVPEYADVFIEAVINEFRPDIVYTHSATDTDPDQRRTFRASMIAAREVAHLYAYQAPTSSVGFQPGLFVNVADYLDEKVQALGVNGQGGSDQGSVRENLIRATALYWGRFSRFAEVEPLEVIRTSG